MQVPKVSVEVTRPVQLRRCRNSRAHSLTNLQAGKVVALGFLAPWRSPMLPNVAEQGMPSLTRPVAVYFVTHRGVPETIQRKLHGAFDEIC
jgi:tripartite-type tricarboxylate transporter receptor subunit TctC